MVIAFDRAQLLADLKPEEGFRGFLYDDRTGQRLRPGMRILGHPTVGYGIALDVDPLTEPEAAILLANRADAHVAAIQKMFPWLTELSDSIQRAVYDLSYNLGDNGLASFATFLSLLRGGDRAAAANDLEATKWYGEVGDRGRRIVALIRAG